MILGLRSTIIPLPDHKLGNIKLGSVTNLNFHRPSRVRCSHSTASSLEEAKERIRETFGKNELSPSSYDTAWVAMVPSRYSMNQPCFPRCLDWILENQREDGSWGLNPSHPLLVKDSLSSTLACLLALRKWKIGDNQVQRGLGFIETHGWAVDNVDQISPLGFDIIFPSMIKYAEKLNLDLPFDPNLVNMMLRERELTIERALKNEFEGNMANVEYFAEGLGELCHWKETMLHQRRNGSLFDSPATTAAALIYHQHDEKCFGYLSSILKLHENWARHKEELQQIKRWFADCKLEQVGSSQNYLYTSYFPIAAILFEPEYGDARLAFAKCGIITTTVDDFFDGFAGNEELQNIIELVERWDGYSTVGFRSERVRIFFLALYKMVEEIAAKAETKQGRCVKDLLINLWIDLLKCMLVELDLWKIKSTTPSIEEYLSIACVTIGVKCLILTSLHLLGPKLSKDVTESSEVSALWNCTAVAARLNNDIHSYKREQAESSTNMVAILISQSQRTISEEEAIRQIKEMMGSKRRELLGMVLQNKESQLPQVCKDLFWTTFKAAYSIHTHGDEYRFPQELKNHINDVIYKPLNQYSP